MGFLLLSCQKGLRSHLQELLIFLLVRNFAQHALKRSSFKYEHKFDFKITLGPLCTVGGSVPFSHFVLAVMGAHPAPLAMLVIPVVDIVNPTVIRPFCG